MVEFKDRTALVVEDQESFREAMAFELECLGFTVVTAKEGHEGFRIASGQKFDLIISDIKMPNWDGRKFLQELHKASADFGSFAFMTGFADLSVQEAYHLGADAFLAKPIMQPKLLQTLLDLMQPKSSRWARLRPRPHNVLTREISDWETSDALDRCAFGKRGMFMTLTEDESHIRFGDRVGFDLSFALGPIGHLTGTGVIVWKRNASKVDPLAAVGIELETVDEPGRGALLRYLEEKRPLASIPLRQGALAKE